MMSTYFLVGITALMILSIVQKQYCYVFPLLIIFTLIYLEKKHKEGYENDPYAYNYDRENPNALVSGRLFGGTVYASFFLK